MDLKSFLFRFGTPFTAGLFLVSAVSGAALYVHAAPGVFHEMHEVLSMVLLAPVAVHLWRNWKALANYVRRPPMAVALVLSLAAAGIFAYEGLSGSGGGGNPAIALVRQAQQAPLSALGPVLKLDEAAAAQRLAAAGLPAPQPGETLATLAARSGREPMEVLSALLRKPS
jgi:hypothetical protein